ncbi:hypothetical protein RFI_20572, partial [Reticulomyxa filosa]
TAAFEYLLTNLLGFPDSVKRTAVYTLGNLCRHKPSPNWTTIVQALRPLTAVLERTTDNETIVDCLWALSYISDSREEGFNIFGEPNTIPEDWPESFQITAVIQTGVVPTIIKFIKQALKWRYEIQNESDELRSGGKFNAEDIECILPMTLKQKRTQSDFLIAPCVRIIGNIASGTDAQTAAVVKTGFFDVIDKCIDYPITNISKESCWALSNVVASQERSNIDLFFEQKNLVKYLSVHHLC